jgi:GNAT superfamily N-acetyltransferase
MIGFARLVTDYTTFAYLTDVFVVREHQRRGLAKWMVRGVKEIVTEWPLLRGLLLMTDNETTAEMYKRELGAVDFDKGPSAGLILLELEGNSCKQVPEGHLMV